MSERTTVRLPEDLLNRAKRKAVTDGRTLTSLIEEGLRLVVSDRAKPASAERVIPRVSKARGQQLVDLDDMSSIQEMDDLEHVERMKRF